MRFPELPFLFTVGVEGLVVISVEFAVTNFEQSGADFEKAFDAFFDDLFAFR